jgi:hypothetical protein
MVGGRKAGGEVSTALRAVLKRVLAEPAVSYASIDHDRRTVDVVLHREDRALAQQLIDEFGDMVEIAVDASDVQLVPPAVRPLPPAVARRLGREQG